jgi:hypothetical protein
VEVKFGFLRYQLLAWGLAKGRGPWYTLLFNVGGFSVDVIFNLFF